MRVLVSLLLLSLSASPIYAHEVPQDIYNRLQELEERVKGLEACLGTFLIRNAVVSCSGPANPPSAPQVQPNPPAAEQNENGSPQPTGQNQLTFGQGAQPLTDPAFLSEDRSPADALDLDPTMVDPRPVVAPSEAESPKPESDEAHQLPGSQFASQPSAPADTGGTEAPLLLPTPTEPARNPPQPAPPTEAVMAYEEGYDIALGAMLRGDYKRAEEAFGDLMDRTTTRNQTSELRFRVGEALFGQERYTEAARTFLAMSREIDDPFVPEALLMLSATLNALGQIDAACSGFAKFESDYGDLSTSVLNAGLFADEVDAAHAPCAGR